MNAQALCEQILACGATKAVALCAEDVVTNAVFREICAQNSCGNYGRCYMCPPDNGDIEELMAKVHSYPHAVLYQSITEIEDSFDFEGMIEAGQSHAALSQVIEAAIKPRMQGYLHLSCGGCRLCKPCEKVNGNPCRYPDRALSSMEGYGIDVYNTTKNTPLAYINGENTVTYFGIVLFTEE